MTTNRQTRRPSRLIYLLILIFGIAVMAFPFASQFIYWQASNVTIENFSEEIKKLDNAEIAERMALAHAYNYSIDDTYLHDPYSEEEQEEGKAEYARMLEIKEQIGTVNIPKISLNLPIYAGTTEAVLQKGVGHLEGTSLPVGGTSTHSVITAHRGLPTARLFTDLDKLTVGDRFYIENINGIMAYQIDQVMIIDPNDFTELMIEAGEDYFTLLTCTPYMINSHRLIVRGYRIPYTAQVQEQDILNYQNQHFYLILFFVNLTLIILVLLVIYIRKKTQ